LLDGRTIDYRRPSLRTSKREDVARTARALAIWREAGTAIDIDGVVLGTFDTLREPTLAFPEREGMR
jgi:hypothetical protein